MITEDYVSFETAKLLKEKGFDEKCSCCYRKKLVDSKIINEEEFFMFASLMPTNSELEDKSYRHIIYCSAPTLQMAMKWLREVHNIGISVYVFNRDLPIEANNVIYTCDISTLNISSKDGHLRLAGSYEEVCEAAIKYCLEYLI